MSTGLARQRLGAERKSWRKDHPHGFFARPTTNEDGTLNMLKWDCGIPGRVGVNEIFFFISSKCC